MGQEPTPGDRTLRLWVAVVVCVVWALSTAADAWPTLAYSPPAPIGGAMLMVVGGLFGAEAIRRRK